MRSLVEQLILKITQVLLMRYLSAYDVLPVRQATLN